jgi:hypothetical protein
MGFNLMSKSFDRFLTWGFEALIIGAIWLGVTALQDISKSVNDLNTKLAVALERTDVHQRAIIEHENRIQALEKRK